MKDSHSIETDSKKIEALNILNSAKWHKEHCEDSECNVSLYLLGETYKTLAEYELNEEERQIFF